MRPRLEATSSHSRTIGDFDFLVIQSCICRAEQKYSCAQ